MKRPSWLGMAIPASLLLVLASILVPTPVLAASKTWSGAGADSNWSTVANWTGGVAPVTADDLIFPVAAARLTNVNDIVSGTVFRSITFQAGGYSISGNALGVNNALGITVASGAAGTISLSMAINLAVNQTFTVTDAAATLNLSGVISATTTSITLTKAGAGTLTLSGTAGNTYRKTTVNAGILLLNKTAGQNAFGGALTIGDGVGGTGADIVRLAASNQIPARQVTILGSGLLDLNNNSDAIGALVMTGGRVTSGTGTFTLGGAITANASSSSATISGNLALGSSNRTFTVNNGTAADDLAITAVISGSRSVTKAGTGTLVLGGTNTYTLATTLSAGTLVVTSNNALGTTTNGTIVSAGATLAFRDGVSYSAAEAVTLNGTGVGGAGALANASGDNSFAGPITLASAATIGSASAGETLTLTGASANGGFGLTFDGAGNTTSNGVISGAGALTKNGAGTLTLGAANTYGGGTTVNAGTLLVTNATGSATGTGAVTVNSGAALGGSNASAITGTATVANGATLTPGVAGAGTLKTGPLLFNNTTNLNFDLGTSRDQVQATGNLTLDGVLNVNPLAGYGAGTYVLFTYTGTLTNNGVTLGSMPAGPAYVIDTSTAGQVKLVASPTVASIVRAGANPTGAASVGFTVTFSEGVTGVDVADFTLTTTGAVASPSVTGVSGSGSVYTVVVATGTGSGTIRLDVTDNNTIIIAGGNPLGGPGLGDGSFTTGQAYTIDKTPPSVVSIVRAGADPTGAASVEFTVTFSENVMGVDTADFTLTTTGAIAGASVTGVAGSGSVYTVTVNTGNGNGTTRLDVTDNDSIVDQVGNPLGGPGLGNGNFTGGQAYTIDKSSPSVAMSSAAGNPTNLSPIPVTVTFTASVTGFDATDIVTSNGTVSGFAGTGASYTFNLTPIANGLVTADIAAGVAVDGTGAGNLAAPQFRRTFDSVAPVVLSSIRAGGTPTNGAAVTFTVTFSESVTGVDVADFTLTTTGAVAGASVTSVTGSGSVYTVTVATGTGDGTLRLDVTDDDSIMDLAGNRLGGTGLGNGNFTAGQSYTIDKTAPTVSMTSAASDPTNVSPIAVTVTFSELVTGFTASDIVPGNGIVSGFAGSGAGYSFNLSPVADGPVTADIAAAAASDAAGSGNIAALQFSRTFDGTASTVTVVDSTAADGTFGLGATIPVTVTFNEPVFVTGTPQLTLATVSNAVVNYTSGSGTAVLTFNYTVALLQSSPDLDYTSTTALALNGGTIKDAAGNNADLTLATPGTPGSLGDSRNIVVNSTLAAVTNVSSTKADGAYGVGTSIDVTVTFSKAVTVTGGPPQITLATAPDAVVNYVSGSGTTTLTFSYVVAAGQGSPDLDYVSATALSANGGTIRDLLLSDAVLTLPDPGTAGSLGFNKNIVIDTLAPAVTSVTSTTANGAYKAGAAINVTVNFTELVTLAGGNLLVTLDTGAVVTIAPFGPAASAAGTYTVVAGQSSADLTAVSPLTLSAGGTLRDAASNNAVLAIPAGQNIADLKAIVIDTVAPTVTSVTSATANGTYKVGAAINVTVSFSEPVTLAGGNLLVTLDTGAVVTIAPFGLAASAAGTYTVAAGQNSADLTAVSPITLSAGGTLRDAASNDGVLAIPAGQNIADLKAIVIDTVAPTVTSVTSATANGAYKEAAVINVTVNFSEPVTLAGGNLLVTLDTGAVVTIAPFGLAASAAGTYTVAAGQNSADLTAVSPLTLSGGTLRDSAANDAVLAIPAGQNIANLKDIVIDTVAPTVAMSSTAPDPTNTSPIPVTVTFSEPVTGFDASDIVASNATVATFVAVSGSVYTFNLSPTTNGPVTADIPAGAAQDLATNLSVAASQFSRTFDTAAKLAFTSAPQTSTAGVATGTITVQLQDGLGNPLNAFGSGRPVFLTSTATGTVTFSPSPSLTIVAGTNSVSFTYTDTQAGSPTITASDAAPPDGATGLADAPQTETVNPGPADHLRITPATANGSVGGTVPMTLQEVDRFDNPVAAALAVTVSVSVGATFTANTIGGANGGNTLAGTLSPSGSGSVTITDPTMQTVTVSGDATGDAQLVANSTSSVTFAGGITISGRVYSDANRNGAFDGTETGLSGVTVRLFSMPANTLTATQTTIADGTYSFAGVADGTYEIRETNPAGYVSTTPDTLAITVSGTAISGQGFGDFAGAKITGVVFLDTGTGGEIPNNGLREANEPGISGVTVKATDSTQTTVYDQTVTDVAGAYSLWIAAPVAAAVFVREVNPASFISTGTTSSSGGTKIDNDTISLPVSDGSTFAGNQFADVPPLSFVPNGAQVASPSGIVVYAHTLTAGTTGQVTLTTNSSLGLTWNFRTDTNGNGRLDAGEPALTTADLNLTTGQVLKLLARTEIPTSTAIGAVDTTTISANQAFANSVVIDTRSVTDYTTISLGSLKLIKSSSVSSAKPGDTATFTLTYTNNGSQPLLNLVLRDSLSPYTTFSSANPPLDAGFPDGSGTLQWTIPGSLAAGASGTVSYSVQIK